jgi:hypothetical protein
MVDTQNELRVAEHAPSPQEEESHTPETPVATLARMLANPRRIRRN